MPTFTIPEVHLVSESNRKREHWAIGYNRAKKQKEAVRRALTGRLPNFELATETKITITLTRHDPFLITDDDNLISAFKHVRDEIAKQLGVNDGDERITWVCKQSKIAHVKDACLVVEIQAE
jgi:hypothetical protein